MPKYWFRRKSAGITAVPCSWEGWVLTVLSLLLCASIVLAGPGIRDNLWRPLFVVLGLTTVLVPYLLIARARGG